jgi:hypothetical protein
MDAATPPYCDGCGYSHWGECDEDYDREPS